MSRPDAYELRVIGHVRSGLTDRSDAPRQGDEGAPDAVLELEESVVPALGGVEPGDDLVLLTWLHLGDRDTLVTYPRGDTTLPLTGVFATRSPDRPNPIGLHRVRVRAIDGPRVSVSGLEAIDGTPVVDLKFAFANPGDR